MQEIDEEKFTALFEQVYAGIDTIILELHKLTDYFVTMSRQMRGLKMETLKMIGNESRWTDADIADAKSIVQCHPECSMVERDGDKLYAGYIVSISPEYLKDISAFSIEYASDYEYVEISAKLLPSLKQGEKVWLKDILGE